MKKSKRARWLPEDVLVYHTWIIASPSGGWADAGPLTPLLPDLSFGVVLFFTLSGFLLL